MILSVIKCCEWNIDYGDATERRDDPPSLLRATADKLRKYGDAAEAVRLRAELTKLVEKV